MITEVLTFRVATDSITLPIVGLVLLKRNGQKNAAAVCATIDELDTTKSELERITAAATELAAAVAHLKAELSKRAEAVDPISITRDPKAFLNKILKEDERAVLNALERLIPDIRLECVKLILNVARTTKNLKQSGPANDPEGFDAEQ
jgi:predicted transcriptional regulator